MFVDHISLMLINIMIGYFLLAGYVYSGLDDREQGKWAAGLLILGLVSLLFGAVMCITWPLPQSFSMAYGELSVLIGIIFLGAGVALAKGWSLTGPVWYGFFAGWAAIVVGIQIIRLKLTLLPALSGIGFILSGAAGVLGVPTWYVLKGNRPFRTAAAAVLVLTALIWAWVVYPAYWHHMDQFRKWMPLMMRTPGP